MPTTTSRTALARDWDAFSRNYHADSVTPFAEGVRFRLPADLRRLVAAWNREKAQWPRCFVDFGCGPGDALELVAGRVQIAVGIDFSAKMLRQAERRLSHRGIRAERIDADRGRNAIVASDNGDGEPRTLLIEADLRNLRRLRGRVDAATAINSICAPTVDDARRMFREMARSLRRGGVLYAVWPALDSLQYLFVLESEAGNSPEAHGDRLDDEGIHTDASGYAVKLFDADQIRRLCAAESLEIETMQKIRYPWEYMRDLGWGYHPGRPRLWDWYVVARRA